MIFSVISIIKRKIHTHTHTRKHFLIKKIIIIYNPSEIKINKNLSVFKKIVCCYVFCVCVVVFRIKKNPSEYWNKQKIKRKTTRNAKEIHNIRDVWRLLRLYAINFILFLPDGTFIGSKSTTTHAHIQYVRTHTVK